MINGSSGLKLSRIFQYCGFITSESLTFPGKQNHVSQQLVHNKLILLPTTVSVEMDSETQIILT